MNMAGRAHISYVCLNSQKYDLENLEDGSDKEGSQEGHDNMKTVCLGGVTFLTISRMCCSGNQEINQLEAWTCHQGHTQGKGMLSDF